MPETPIPVKRRPPAEDTVGSIAQRVREISQQNDRLFKELLAGERRFRRLAKAVWKVQEEERRRLARELHDGIGQTLTALKNQLEWTERQNGPQGAEAAAGLAEAIEMAGRALADTRELSRLLRPTILDDLGLEPALRWLTRTLEQRGGPAIALRVEGLGGRLEPDLETLAYRVIQEALTNVLKHSGAERVEVSVEARAGRLRLAIHDTGHGFDPATVLGPADGSSGVGLRGIRDRVELFGGRLRIDSAPGSGCRIEASVPLSPEEEP